jgi:hypothetical protein
MTQQHSHPSYEDGTQGLVIASCFYSSLHLELGAKIRAKGLGKLAV